MISVPWNYYIRSIHYPIHKVIWFNIYSGIAALSPSSDNCYMIYPNSGPSGGDLLLFDAADMKAITVIQAHKSPCSAIGFSHDGTKIATASDKVFLSYSNVRERSFGYFMFRVVKKYSNSEEALILPKSILSLFILMHHCSVCLVIQIQFIYTNLRIPFLLHLQPQNAKTFFLHLPMPLHTFYHRIFQKCGNHKEILRMLKFHLHPKDYPIFVLWKQIYSWSLVQMDVFIIILWIWMLEGNVL